jgi:protein O-mannosyl-transferase
MTDSTKFTAGRTVLLISLFLLILTCGVYLQVKDHQFINYDDTDYVVSNAHIRSGFTQPAIRWAFTTTYFSNWHPLTWLSYMLDYRLFGLKAGGYHLVNLLFHVLNTLLLFYILNRMTHAIWRSAAVAVLFALHPTHVESVAWVSERKDVLSTFFGMAAIGAYIFYAAKPGLKRYWPVVLLFILSLMAKPMMVTLPFALLLFDYWPLKRYQPLKIAAVEEKGEAETEPAKKGGKKKKTEKQRHNTPVAKAPKHEAIHIDWSTACTLLLEKVPLFILSGLSCIVTYIAQAKGGAIAGLQAISFTDRLQNVVLSYARYILNTVYPVKLGYFYPQLTAFPVWKVAGSLLLIILITAFALRSINRRPYLAVGWLFFLGTLVPVIGLVSFGSQSIADRYLYLPGIGLYIMAVWGICDLSTGWRERRIILGISGGIVIAALAVMTFAQVEKWKNSETIATHTLNVMPDNHAAYFCLGLLALEHGQIDEAANYYEKALKLAPANTVYLNNMGNIMQRRGRKQEAMGYYAESLRYYADNSEAHFNMAHLLAEQGRYQEAESHYRTVVDLDPDDYIACTMLADVLAAQGKTDDALKYYSQALRQKEALPSTHYAMGRILFERGRPDEAARSFQRAVLLNPGSAPAHHYWGRALLAQGRYQEAVVQFQEALRIQPGSESTKRYLAEALTKVRNR